MMHLACLTPTYKRPKCLASAVACYLAQNRNPSFDSRLFILDDAGQFDTAGFIDNHDGNGQHGMEICSLPPSQRISSLPLKYNRLVEIALDRVQPHRDRLDEIGFVIWEDDDVFLPWHLEQIADAFSNGWQFYRQKEIYGNYGRPKGECIREPADGRFHSSWAIRGDLLKQIGGWEDIRDENGNPRLIFDQHIGSKAKQADPRQLDKYDPSYVYRWGNGIYHGSQSGDSGYKQLWDSLEKLDAPFVGKLVPEFDDETREFMRMPRGAAAWTPTEKAALRC